MNYLKLTQTFWNKHDKLPFTGNQTLLYWRLVYLFNKEGDREVWPESMQFQDGSLSHLVGISVNTMIPCRNALEERGLIDFESTGKGCRGGGTYRLLEATSSKSSSKRSSKSDEVADELPNETSANFDEVESKDTQQPHQKDHQILSRSYIYIESKPPNLQTLKKTLLVAHRNESSVRVAWYWLLKNKKKQKPPSSGAPPKLVTQIKNLIEARVEGYYWTGKDGKAAQQLADKLRNAITSKRKSEGDITPCTDEDIINSLIVLLDQSAKLKEYYQFTDVPTLNGKFNEILTQLRIPRQPSSTGKPVAPAHATPEQRISKVDALFKRIDQRTGTGGGG
ncbi:hypothetical protein [Spirosoma litoris]